MHLRSYSFRDGLCLHFDRALRAVLDNPATTGRSSPAITLPEADLTTEERRHAASLMRVNHAGEVCAQALYHGQSMTLRSAFAREQMEKAAVEEGDHLYWCATRLQELGSHTSYLNLLWYIGSFGIGVIAGVAGDRWSLGFLAETESQVVQHLEKHLALLPTQDQKSAVILETMREDEKQHQADAVRAGGAALPFLIKKCMSFTSKMMVKTAYWL